MREKWSAHDDYAGAFRCIGGKCEDTCCAGWTVPVDQPTYEKYLQLAPSPLGRLIQGSVEAMPPGAGGAKPSAFARLKMNEGNQCPLLSADRLCRVHGELGEGLLSHACAVYPRIAHTSAGIEERALSLSCPEAARLVLLTPHLRLPAERPPATSGEAAKCGANPLLAWYWRIRKAIVNLVRNRQYPMWQRLFLLGILCRRLDSIAAGELHRTAMDFLRDFEATVATGALQGQMDALPIDNQAQLDVVLRLAGMMLHRSNVRPRFVECIQAFTAGIGNGPQATLESLAAHYALVQEQYFAPFVRRSPYILENYLLNTIVRCRFPFGREAMQEGSAYSMMRQFSLLAAQFALMRGLLIGVAGFHGKDFSPAHVVHAVQAASKHFEHHPEFLSDAHALLVESRMDGARGLAILLRDAEPSAPTPPALRRSAPDPQAQRPN